MGRVHRFSFDTPDQLDRVRGLCVEYGLTRTGDDDGDVTGGGIRLRYGVDLTHGRLTLDVVHLPDPMTTKHVFHRVQQALDGVASVGQVPLEKATQVARIYVRNTSGNELLDFSVDREYGTGKLYKSHIETDNKKVKLKHYGKRRGWAQVLEGRSKNDNGVVGTLIMRFRSGDTAVKVDYSIMESGIADARITGGLNAHQYAATAWDYWRYLKRKGEPEPHIKKHTSGNTSYLTVLIKVASAQD